ncbi:MAG: dephospho-CoA kinase [Planctomycetota bacterium]|nr:dephospho-CoA kinase [Planctomycetota bacterium]MCZ6698366.1 dephospho-CoA kinase [Planctomycetota bacterium]MCZ6816185.1 dephospho-CoA kinase [Planctomycetota bacterium]
MSGGVGAGKSAVAKILAELGAGVIDSDVLSRQELDTQEIKDALVRWWGSGVLEAGGSINRQKVASIVFGDPSQRHRLESLLHPRIAVRRSDLIAEFEARADIRMIVLDSPLLYEVDLDLLCEAVVFVEADEAVRKQRSEKDRQWSEEELSRREKSQQPLDMKRARADYICVNNSSLDALRDRVKEVFTQIVSKSCTV